MTALDTPFSPPGPGRSYAASRRVRLGDVLPSGHVRLDAVVRYLQDVAADDVRDAGIEGDVVWVVRRTGMVVAHRPRYNTAIDLLTWCSGTGAAWAERRTTVSVDGRPAVEAVCLWVSLDPGTLRPTALPDHFFEVYGPDARRRSVRSRLVHPGPPATRAATREWPLRRSDFDVVGHVNNAVGWAAVEEEVDRLQPGATIEVGDLEYRAAIPPGTHVRLISELADDAGSLWLVDDAGVTLVSAQVRLA